MHDNPTVVQDIFDYFRSIPLVNDHYDKLIAILAVVAIVYFVGSMARNVLIGALVVFLLWGFRYQDLGNSRHENRYTGAVCDTTSECWQPEKISDIYDRSSHSHSSYDRSQDDRSQEDRSREDRSREGRLSDDRSGDDRSSYDRPRHDRSSDRY